MKKEKEKEKKKEVEESFIKKYWFVLFVCILFVVFIGLYTKSYIESLPVEVDTKEVDGKSVLIDIDGEDIYADDVYNLLYLNSGVTSEYSMFMNAVLNAAYETTSDMSNNAATMASYYLQYYGEDTMLNYVAQSGYTNGLNDLTNYFVTYLKNVELIKDYYDANYDEYVPAALEEMGEKAVYHILVKVADVVESTDESGNTIHTANPTEDETAKLNAVLEALKTKDFEEVAKEYSEDSSASSGGFLAVTTDSAASSTYVQEFADAVATLTYDEVSEPITSQYGYHIIMVKSPTKEQCLADSQFLLNLNSHYESRYSTILMEKASELNYVIYDENLLDQINTEIENAKESEAE